MLGKQCYGTTHYYIVITNVMAINYAKRGNL